MKCANCGRGIDEKHCTGVISKEDRFCSLDCILEFYPDEPDNEKGEGMNILAIDPGLNKMAACFMGEDDIEHYHYQDNRTEKEILDKLLQVKYFIREIIMAITYLSIIVIEDYPYSRSTAQTARIAEVKGVIFAELARLYFDKQIIRMSISTWKAYLPTELKGIKKTTQEYIDTCNRINGTDFVINDQVDAYYMAYTATQISKGDVRTDGAKNLYKKITGKDYTGNVGTV